MHSFVNMILRRNAMIFISFVPAHQTIVLLCFNASKIYDNRSCCGRNNSRMQKFNAIAWLSRVAIILICVVARLPHNTKQRHFLCEEWKARFCLGKGTIEEKGAAGIKKTKKDRPLFIQKCTRSEMFAFAVES